MSEKAALMPAGTAQVDKIILQGLFETVDITNLFMEFSIYEDIFSHTMHGTITILDSFNMPRHVPIMGDEKVFIEFKTHPECAALGGVEPKVIKKKFHVTRLDNRIVGADKRQMYVLSIVSNECVTDLNIKLAKSFTGTSDSMIKQMFDYVKEDKELETDSAIDTLKFVSPLWSPFQCINWCVGEARDGMRSSNFFFYETNQKFKFKTLNKLFKQGKKATYRYDMDSMRSADGENTYDVKKQFERIRAIKFDYAFDYVKRMQGQKLLSHKVYEHNKLFKTIQRHSYSYYYDFDQSLHLDPDPLMFIYPDFRDYQGSMEHRTIHPRDHEVMTKDYSAEIMSKRLGMISQADMYTIDIEVKGRSDLEVGDLIEFKLGEYDANMDKTPDDKMYDGLYMIAAIHHRCSGNQYQQTMKIIKDSCEKTKGENTRGILEDAAADGDI